MAALAITAAREMENPVIFIQHKSASGMEINEMVEPMPGEKIFVKEEVNSFLGTGLKEHLDGLEIDTLVICGMQTQMCVEAAVRAAHDYGYHVILIHDACATRNLKFGDREVISSRCARLNTGSTQKLRGSGFSSRMDRKIRGNL